VADLYDTAKIREAARQMQRLAGAVEDDAVYELRRAEDAAEVLKGKAAEALLEQLALKQRALRANAQRLADTAAKLRAYADSLEAADQEVAALMREGGEST